MKSAERPLREPGRLGTVCAPGTHPGVLKRPDSQLQQHPGLPLVGRGEDPHEGSQEHPNERIS